MTEQKVILHSENQKHAGDDHLGKYGGNGGAMTFSSGNGPIPKIRTGSMKKLITSPLVVARKAARLLPMAVNSPVNVWFKNEKKTRPQVI